jgi:hypothetical protein
MWSRAKRESGQKGERVGEEVWNVCLAQGKTEEVKVVAGDEEMDELMDEAVERGYGSDAETKSGVRQRKVVQ